MMSFMPKNASQKYSKLSVWALFAISFTVLLISDAGIANATNVREYIASCKKKWSWCCTTSSVTQISQTIFNNYRKNFIMNSFYTGTVDPSFKKVADEFRNVEVFKTAAYGSFLDASILMDTLRDLRVLSAKTLQSYTPSEQICRFGTLSRSLSASEEKVDANRLVLSEAGLSRNLGTQSSLASAGRGLDNQNRLHQFADSFCDIPDNNNGLNQVCDVANPVSDTTQNRDVNFTRTLDNMPTINADFTDANLTQDETSTIAMANYLYGHRQPSKRISATELGEKGGTASLYREYRSVIARRAAAQNSYNTLASMKSAGSGASDDYMRAILEQLGLSAADADKYLGAQTTKDAAKHASYNAQMDILSKKLYQEPTFYANLMDSKTNVSRTSAAIQGIGLMQGRDIYRSMERSEMLLGLLVEMEARKMVTNNQNLKGQ
jgi:hypothetical protein